jgi:hypothetical protein
MKNRRVSRFAALAGVLLAPWLAGNLTAQQKPAPAGPFATKASVEVKSETGAIPLKREEQIAFMFVDAINSLEDDCGRHAAEPCTLEALVRGPKAKDSFGVGKLKFDPNASDPNYAYKVALAGSNWEIWANPKKPGLGGFYAKGKFFGGKWYNPAGPATAASTKITESSVDGDLFWMQ